METLQKNVFILYNISHVKCFLNYVIEDAFISTPFKNKYTKMHVWYTNIIYPKRKEKAGIPQKGMKHF